MIEDVHDFQDRIVVMPDFDTESALAHGRHHDRRVEILGDSVLQTQAPDTGCSKDDGVKALCFEFPQPGVQVSPKRYDHGIRPGVFQLGSPPEAAGADSGAVVKL